MVTGGLGDRWDRRRVFVIGPALFGIASVLGAFSPSPELLTAACALRGIDGAALLPSGRGGASQWSTSQKYTLC
ncbi:MFS transporter [Agrococcus casei]|uniref:MFS transporter n=1 Tax=Microbacteriaceae TaxID=85023 RepID=UPI000DF12FBA|nr:MFS transporter [Microbacterium sp. JB110]